MPLPRDITAVTKFSSNGGAIVEITNPNETDPDKAFVRITAASYKEAVTLEANQKNTIDPTAYPLKSAPIPAKVVAQPTQIIGKPVGAIEPAAEAPKAP